MKLKAVEIQKLVDELFKRPIFPTPIIIEIEPKVEIENIWSVSIGEEGRERKKRK